MFMRAGLGGLENVAQRNVKPDQHVTGPTLLNLIKKLLLIPTLNPAFA
jgi:hypothetical protein